MVICNHKLEVKMVLLLFIILICGLNLLVYAMLAMIAIEWVKSLYLFLKSKKIIKWLN